MVHNHGTVVQRLVRSLIGQCTSSHWLCCTQDVGKFDGQLIMSTCHFYADLGGLIDGPVDVINLAPMYRGRWANSLASRSHQLCTIV